jgi:hypothetical protein
LGFELPGSKTAKGHRLATGGISAQFHPASETVQNHNLLFLLHFLYSWWFDCGFKMIGLNGTQLNGEPSRISGPKNRVRFLRVVGEKKAAGLATCGEIIRTACWRS